MFTYYTCIVILVCFYIASTTGYSVVGNKILDPSGNEVLIRGVDRPSFEWSPTGEQASASDYALMRKWGANVVRIALNQDFWLQKSAYSTTIDQQIGWATTAGLGVILDLHWNNGEQQNMADRNSITFWGQVARRYKNNPWVMFELYNEPHDVSWNQWLKGDATYAGMQEMYDAVRATGANNCVLIGGLNWAFDLSGVGAGYKVTGSNIIYATHPYDYPGKQISDWQAAFGYLAASYPVVMTEFGQYCATNTYVADLLAYAQLNKIHWTAWAWYASGCAFPSIIADWNGTPTPGVGQLVKSYLSGNAPAPSASVPTTPASTTPVNTPTIAPVAASTLSVYTDSLASGWQDWSWASSYSLSDTSRAHSGSKSIKFQVMSYQGVYLHAPAAVAIGSYGALQFYVSGANSISAGSVSVKIYGTGATVIGNAVNFPLPILANQWSLMSISIPSFGLTAGTQITGFVIQSNVDTSVGNIWIDDVSLTAGTATPAPASVNSPATNAPATNAPATNAPATNAPSAPSGAAPTKTDPNSSADPSAVASGATPTAMTSTFALVALFMVYLF